MADAHSQHAELPSLHALSLSPPPALPSTSSSVPPPPDSASTPSTARPRTMPRTTARDTTEEICYWAYQGEEDLAAIVALVDEELSEPYNLYTYRYFLDEWPHLCFFAFAGAEPVGVIICKQEPHTKSSRSLPARSGDGEAGEEEARRPLMRGYLAMLSTKKAFRGRGVATHLLRLSLSVMLHPPASLLTSLPPSHPSHHPVDEIVLETEADNAAALAFYARAGFVREKRLFRFYLNGKDAYRLRLDLSGCAGL